MAKVSFLERLKNGVPILGDGAMATMLHQHGGSMTMCFDELNRQSPGEVASVHRAYIEAGAELIETNTFGANRYKLAKHGLENDVVAINKAGVDLAKSVIRNLG